MSKLFDVLNHYEYPSDYQIKKIRALMDVGIKDKWQIEQIINGPTSNNPIIIDFIETEMEIYLKEKRYEKEKKKKEKRN